MSNIFAVVFLVLLVLKLAGVFVGSWWWVFAPLGLWAFAIVVICLFLYTLGGGNLFKW